ncbi:MAG: bifunctional riboflavin kinase/FAD synthetase [Clostridium sp.]
METIKSISEIGKIQNSVITIGNFDGLHNGHQVLVKKAVEYAKLNNMKSVVFTFENHPANYFKRSSVKKIISNKEKTKRINNLDVDIMISIPFDEYMTKISAEDFVRDILVDRLGAKRIIVGYDFTFARNKEGNSKILESLSEKYGFEVEVVKPVKISNIRVSSTYIRSLVEGGFVSKVKKYLGYNYQVEGKVIYSKQLGRTIGFPTANIEIKEYVLTPRRGIYATKVYIGKEIYFGATNVGYNPTVNGDKLSIETYILEFNQDIYGKIIKLEFLERIRDEKKFNSLEELKQQLKKDTKFVYEKYVCKNA